MAADFLRRKLLAQRVSFSFETVMSSPDKVALLETAQRLGYPYLADWTSVLTIFGGGACEFPNE